MSVLVEHERRTAVKFKGGVEDEADKEIFAEMIAPWNAIVAVDIMKFELSGEFIENIHRCLTHEETRVTELKLCDIYNICEFTPKLVNIITHPGNKIKKLMIGNHRLGMVSHGLIVNALDDQHCKIENMDVCHNCAGDVICALKRVLVKRRLYALLTARNKRVGRISALRRLPEDLTRVLSKFLQ